MASKKVGFKKDYTQAYDWLQRDLRGKTSEEKRQAYKSFYKSIAKVADQRLIELERLSQKEGFKEVKQWAYKDAMREIRGMFGEDAKRFNRRIPDNLNSIYKDINRVLNFLEMPSSSVQGIREVYDKRANTVNDKYSTDLTWSTVGDLYESILWKKVNAKYGSKTTLLAIGRIQANEKKIKKALKEHKPISLHLADETFDITDSRGNKEKVTSQVVEETVNKMLRYYKKDVSKLIKRL